MALPRSGLALAFALACAPCAGAQETPTFSSDVQVVSLLATVRDRDGAFVSSLQKDDFTLLVDGKPRPIRYFSQVTGLPLKLGLLVDTSRSQTHVLDQESRASYVFLDRMLRPEEDAALIASFDERVQILQPLTGSRKELQSALNLLRIPGRYATLIYSAIRDASENHMRKQAGRKALILLTDRVAFRDPVNIATAIEFAQRADCLIFSIRFADPIKAYRPVRAAVQGIASEGGKTALRRMSRETGGAAFEVKGNQTIEQIYDEIESVLRNQYSLGFTPDRDAKPGAYRKLKLIPKEKTFTVTTRDGYYAN